MKIFSIFLIFLISLLFVIISVPNCIFTVDASPPEDDFWPTLMHDIARSGIFSTAGDAPIESYGLKNRINIGKSEVALEASCIVDDICGDSNKEIIACIYDYCYVFNSEGKTIWNYQMDKQSLASPTVIDITGDGQKEIILIASHWGCFGTDATLHILSNEGELIKKEHFSHVTASMCVGCADINNDGIVELLISLNGETEERMENSSGKGTLHCFVLEETSWFDETLGGITGGYKLSEIWKNHDAGAPSAPALEDIDKDGKLEIVIADYYRECITAIDDDGSTLWKYDTTPDEEYIWGAPKGSVSFCPRIVDVDNDDEFEIIGVTGQGKIHIMNINGELKYEISYSPMRILHYGYALYDLDDNGILEIIGNGISPYIPKDIYGDYNVVVAIKLSGEIAWETHLERCEKSLKVEGNPWQYSYDICAADIDGDGTKEIIVAWSDGSLTFLNGTNGNIIHSYRNPNGRTLDKKSPIPNPMEHMAITDIDNDGILEIICETNEPYGINIYGVCPKINITSFKIEKGETTGDKKLDMEISCHFAPSEKEVPLKVELYKKDSNWDRYNLEKELFNDSIGILQAGEVKKIAVPLNLNNEKDTFKVIATVDPGHTIWKSDETHLSEEIILDNGAFASISQEKYLPLMALCFVAALITYRKKMRK